MRSWRLFHSSTLGALLFVSVLLASFVSSPATAALVRGHTELYSLGTWVTADFFTATDAQKEKSLATFEKQIALYNTMFTVHDEGPLFDVNKNAGKWSPVPCQVAELMVQAKEIAKESDRAFEPTIGPVVNAWKIGFGGKRVPSPQELKVAASHVDYRRVEVDETPGACRIRIGADQNVDLGAIAKGWIGSALARDVERTGVTRGIIDLGGNIVLIGKHPDGDRDWNVGIQDPSSDRGEILGSLKASNASVITSGDYERYLEKDGKRYGHILDARTGEPSTPDMGSITIVNADGAKADGWCTALFAMGIQKALVFLESRPDIHALIVDAALKNAWVTPALAGSVELTRPGLTLHVIPMKK